MNFDQTLQVKQFVACVKGTDGGRETGRFMVLETGSAQHYLFVQLDPRYGTTTGLSFPVEKKRLRDDVRRALAAGRGNCGMRAADDGRPFRFLPPGATWTARTPAPEEKMTTQTTRPHDEPDRYDRLDALLADRRRAHQEKQEAEQGHALLRQQLEEARGRLDAARAAYHAACAAIDAACAAPEVEQQQHQQAPQQSPEETRGAVENTHENDQQQHQPAPPRARVVCTADDLASVDGGPLWHLGFLPGCLKKLSDEGRTVEVLPRTEAQAVRAREAVAAHGLGGAVVVPPAAPETPDARWVRLLESLLSDPAAKAAYPKTAAALAPLAGEWPADPAALGRLIESVDAAAVCVEGETLPDGLGAYATLRPRLIELMRGSMLGPLADRLRAYCEGIGRGLQIAAEKGATPAAKPKRQRKPKGGPVPPAPSETSPPPRPHDWHEARGATCCRLCGVVRRGGDEGACPGPAAPSGELFADPTPTPTALTERM